MVELKKAYRNAALKSHPDCGGTNEEFILVDAAYDTNSQFAIRNSQLRNLDLARLSGLTPDFSQVKKKYSHNLDDQQFFNT